MQFTPGLADLLAAFRHSFSRDIHTMMPGKVVKFYPATSTSAPCADVQPMVKRVYWTDEDVDGTAPGEAVYESYPVIPQVPVMFPGGSGFVITWPVSVGDDLQLVFSEDSLADYLLSGKEAEQTDIGRHKLANCVAHPVRPPYATSVDAAVQGNAVLTIGQEGGVQQIQIDPTNGWIILGAGATDFVAMAAKTNAAIDAVVTWVLTGTGAGSTYVPPVKATYTPANVGSIVTKTK